MQAFDIHLGHCAFVEVEEKNNQTIQSKILPKYDQGVQAHKKPKWQQIAALVQSHFVQMLPLEHMQSIPHHFLIDL